MGKLYLIPSFIAEQQTANDLPPSTLQVIKSLRHYLVENERTARRFISSLKLEVNIPELHLRVLDKHTADTEIGSLMDPLKNGFPMGILSEAGSPGVADPGSRAVEWAHKNNITVVPLTGPSSLLLALMASGLNGQAFCFHGYLPIKEGDRKKKLEELQRRSELQRETQLFIEAPYRNEQLLKSMLKYLHPNTKLCVAKDIGGSEEEIKTLFVRDWKKIKTNLHKIPVVFLFQR